MEEQITKMNEKQIQEFANLIKEGIDQAVAQNCQHESVIITEPSKLSVELSSTKLTMDELLERAQRVLENYKQSKTKSNFKYD